ncbi:hypothetical protein POM88_020077 [Heracleum sosnowskyi]|uniref:Uncharacterized protein n=1 Tax=Heracleum sosnowskyi TaxID=360622 RepID=A0AAD8IAP8_9APIA|nr:hypothetical protein POM88_020077 [Heracleum sosnowskyi]
MGLVEQATDDAGLHKNEIDEIVLVGGSTRIENVRQLLKDYFNGLKPNMGVNPDEVVAYGATVLGGILSGEEVYESLPDLIFWQRFPVSLGIETKDGLVTKLIHRNSIDLTPTRRSHVITTLKDQQTNVSIKVFQGQSKFTKNCRLLGKFNLSGITLAPRFVLENMGELWYG